MIVCNESGNSTWYEHEDAVYKESYCGDCDGCKHCYFKGSCSSTPEAFVCPLVDKDGSYFTKVCGIIKSDTQKLEELRARIIKFWKEHKVGWEPFRKEFIDETVVTKVKE